MFNLIGGWRFAHDPGRPVNGEISCCEAMMRSLSEECGEGPFDSR